MMDRDDWVGLICGVLLVALLIAEYMGVLV